MTYSEPEATGRFFSYPEEPAPGSCLSRWPAAGGSLVRLDAPAGRAAFLATAEALMERASVPVLTDRTAAAASLSPASLASARFEPVRVGDAYYESSVETCLCRSGSGSSRDDVLSPRFRASLEDLGPLRCGPASEFVTVLRDAAVLFFQDLLHGPDRDGWPWIVPVDANPADPSAGGPLQMRLLGPSPEPYAYPDSLFGGTPKAPGEVLAPPFRGTCDFCWPAGEGPSPFVLFDGDAGSVPPSLWAHSDVVQEVLRAPDGGQFLSPKEMFSGYRDGDLDFRPTGVGPLSFADALGPGLASWISADPVRNWLSRPPSASVSVTGEQWRACLPAGPRRSWCAYGVVQTMLGLMRHTGAVFDVGMRFRTSTSVRTRSWAPYVEPVLTTGVWPVPPSEISPSVFRLVRPSTLDDPRPSDGCDDVEGAVSGESPTVAFSRSRSVAGSSPDGWTPLLRVTVFGQYATGFHPAPKTASDLDLLSGGGFSRDGRAEVSVGGLVDEALYSGGVLPLYVEAFDGGGYAVEETFSCTNTASASVSGYGPAEAAQHEYPARAFESYVASASLTFFDEFDDGVAERSWDPSRPDGRVPLGRRFLFRSHAVDLADWRTPAAKTPSSSGYSPFGETVCAHAAWLLSPEGSSPRLGLSSVTRPDAHGVPSAADAADAAADAWLGLVRSGTVVYLRDEGIRLRGESADRVLYLPSRVVFPRRSPADSDVEVDVSYRTVDGDAVVRTEGPYDVPTAYMENVYGVGESSVPTRFFPSAHMFGDARTFAERFDHWHGRGLASVEWGWKAMPVSGDWIYKGKEEVR